ASLNGITGMIQFQPVSGESWGKVSVLSCTKDSIPTSCPACGVNWRSRSDEITSPISAMGTGYHKMGQVAVEQIFESLDANRRSDSEKSKLVVFSDSRRDAARAAAELEFNHYKD